MRLEGRHLGRYRLVRTIAHGAMGQIWEAWDERLNRRVAVKIMHASEALTKDGLERFRREARNAAKLRHPNIVPIHDVGQAEGLDFIVMDFVDGFNLAEALRQQEMTWREKVILLEKICRAVQYAHEQGVIHRDLKPGNVMLDWGRGDSSKSGARVSSTPRARTPSSAPERGPTSPTGPTGPTGPTRPPGPNRPTGPNLSPPPPATPAPGDDQPPRAAGLEPLVLDFGLAKDLEADVTLTQSGMSIGTPAYMPPEQAEGRLKETGPWSDVYSLGAMLYELLTGRVPFTGENRLQVLRACILDDPVPPRRLSPRAPRDLETICLKCLEKTPQRRYQTVAALAADLRAWLDGENIVARPPTLFERARRRVRRHAALYATVVCAALAILGLTVGFMFSLYERRREAERARDSAVAAQGAEAAARHAAELARAAEAAERLKADAARHAAEEARAAEAAERQKADTARQTAEAATSTAEREAYASEIRLAAAQVEAGEIGHANLILDGLPRGLRHWEWGRLKFLCRREERILKGHSTEVTALAVSPDGKTLASAARDGSVCLWDAGRGWQVVSLKGHNGLVTSASFSLDGLYLITMGQDNWLAQHPNSTACIWDLRTGRERLAFETHTGSGCPAVFSPDGRRALTSSKGNTATIWDAVTGQELSCLRGHQAVVSSCAFSPDGRLAATTAATEVKVWDSTTGKELRTLRGPPVHDTSALAFSPNGRYLMVIGSTQWSFARGECAAVVWEAETGKESAVLRHDSGIRAGCFAPDSSSVATGSWSGTLQRWQLPSGKAVYATKAHKAVLNQVQFSADGLRLLTCSRDQTACVWDAASGQLQHTLRGHTDGVVRALFFPGSQRVVTASQDGTVRIWDPIKTKEEKRVFDCGHAGICVAFFLEGGKKLLIGDSPSEDVVRIRSLDLPGGQELASHTVPMGSGVWFEVNHKRLLNRVGDKFSFHDLATGKTLWTIPAGEYTTPAGVYGMAWFREGGDILLLLTEKGDGYAVVDAQTGKLLWSRKEKPWTSRLADDTTASWALGDGKLFQLDRLTGAARLFWENPALTRDCFLDVSEDGNCVLVSGTGVPTAWDVKGNRVLFTVGRDGDRAFYCDKGIIGTDDPKAFFHNGTLWDGSTGKKLIEVYPPGSLYGPWTESLYKANQHRSRAERWMFVFDTSARDYRIVDLETGKVVSTLANHRAESDAVFSKDGKRMLTTDAIDHAIRLWDVATGRELLNLKGHTAEVSRMEFSPDGLSILTSANDGTAILWPAVDWTKE